MSWLPCGYIRRYGNVNLSRCALCRLIPSIFFQPLLLHFLLSAGWEISTSQATGKVTRTSGVATAMRNTLRDIYPPVLRARWPQIGRWSSRRCCCRNCVLLGSFCHHRHHHFRHTVHVAWRLFSVLSVLSCFCLHCGLVLFYATSQGE